MDQVPEWPRPRGAPRPQRLDRSLETLSGVGKTVQRRLARLGLETLGDLLRHRPRRYVDPTRIADLFGEEETVIEGDVLRASSRRARGRMTVQNARVKDESGEVDCVWFNQPWVAERLRPGIRVRVIGHLRRGAFAVRSHDVLEEASPPGLVPVYPASEDVTSGFLRRLVDAVLPEARALPDPLPATVREAEGLPLRADALHAVHRPRGAAEAEEGRGRLAFDELLVLQLGLARRAAEREQAVAPALGPPGELIDRYRAALPFALTPFQEQAVRELDADLARAVPMQRLLQGEVGSGKTVVALYALLRAVEAGFRGALMAPTETLAEQHFLTVEGICRELGVTCSLLTSSVPARERRAGAGAQLVVGTHALIQEGVELDYLAVAVVDEQHRFGVEQRQALVSGRSPHVLHMTATPIPRTLALTVYGDLQVSEIAKPPADRKPVVTRWIPEERASEAYRRLTRLLREGRQAYVVCPLVTQSEKVAGRAAEAEAERLRAGELG
ncbi:MAG: DEAD/DEAH box helicase, partial [Thermoleophilia bacterium]|nr:DEAD/DEAH box helicase [Thermoleophilia bacterium]